MNKSLFHGMKNTTLKPIRLEPQPKWTEAYREELIITALIIILFVFVLWHK